MCCCEFDQILGKYLSLYSCNTLISVYKNASHRGHCATLNLCNDFEIIMGLLYMVLILL